MKKISLLILTAGLFFLGGCDDDDNYIETSPTLMEALKNPKSNELAGDEGVYIIFAQSRDEKTVTNIEALDTLYFLSAVGTTQTHVYETNKYIDVIDDQLVDDVWAETVIYHPNSLPNINFDTAYNTVKEVAGDKPIANISIRYELIPEEPLIISFVLPSEISGLCDEYDYYVETDEAELAANDVSCYFNIDPT